MKSEGRRTRYAGRILAATMVLLVAGFSGCAKKAAEKPPVVSVQAAMVKRAAIERVIGSEAVLFPLQEAAITPKIAAPVAKFYVNRGSRVHQGQLLAVLENRDLAAAAMESRGAFAQAQASYATTTAANLPAEIQKAKLDVEAAKELFNAERKLYRSRKNLYQQGALPRKQLDQSAVALTQARNQYQIAERHLAALHAVGEKTADEGGPRPTHLRPWQVPGGQGATGLFRNPQSDRWSGHRPADLCGRDGGAGQSHADHHEHHPGDRARPHPAEEAALLRAGDGATVNAPGVGDIPAKVTLVSPAVDPNSTTVEVWVEAANPDGRLRPGSTVHVSMMAQTVPDAIVIPAAGLLTASDGSTSVMVIGNDGRAHQQRVATGIRQDDEVQITQGLTPGQEVVTVGAYGLPDNSKVEVATASKGTKRQTEAANKEKP